MHEISSKSGLVCLVAIAIISQMSPVNGANILGLFISPSPSHLIVHMGIAEALAEKGHNVTVVSSTKPKTTHENIREIVVPLSDEDAESLANFLTKMATKKNTPVSMIKDMFGSGNVMLSIQLSTLKDKRIEALWKTPDTKFDLVILGYFFNDFQLAVAARFNCPIIVSWSGAQMEAIETYVGTPREVSYVPSMYLSAKTGGTLGFRHRLQNLIAYGAFRLVIEIMELQYKHFYNELAPSDDKNFPTYEEMKKNVSLFFCNSHSLSEGPIRPNVPGLVEIGGIQVKEKPDVLPKDIDDFLNASKHGAVLLSLGSNLQGSHLKPEIVSAIFNTLKSLKQNVIWKWEDLNKTPGKASNILYKKWLPQDDILAHPKMKLFITHAGKGGVAEAQYHGVPMVALPSFGDQNTNARKLAEVGQGLFLDLLNLSEEEFRNATTEVLTNPVYSKNVKRFSQLYRDRALTAKQTAVYWSEYVIRHHGAPHLQSTVIHMTFIERNNLDILLVIGIIFWIIFKVWVLVLKMLVKALKNRFAKKRKTKKH